MVSEERMVENEGTSVSRGLQVKSCQSVYPVRTGFFSPRLEAKKVEG